MTSVLIVDDHPAVRAGLRPLVAGEPGLRVVGVEGDAEAGLAAVERHAPDVVVLDVRLPGEDGLDLCLRLGATPRPPAVVLYSAFADESLAVLAAISGAHALLPKSSDPARLLDAIRAVAAGARLLPMASPETLQRIGAALDPSDLPVLGMLLHGTSPPHVAHTLGMSAEWLHARRWAMLRRLRPHGRQPDAHALSRVPAG